MSLIPDHKFSKTPIPEIPNGIYKVTWSGWEGTLKVPQQEGKEYTFEMKGGVRGISHYEMEVRDGELWSI